jgi:hypothetical protein
VAAFAGLIVDERRRELILARDRIGVRPLHNDSFAAGQWPSVRRPCRSGDRAFAFD